MDKKETNYVMFIGLALVGLGYLIYNNKKKTALANAANASSGTTATSNSSQTSVSGQQANAKQTLSNGSTSTSSSNKSSGGTQLNTNVDFPHYQDEQFQGYQVGYYDGHTNFIIS